MIQRFVLPLPIAFFVFCVLISTVPHRLVAIPSEVPPSPPGADLLEEAITLIFSKTGTDTEISRLLDEAEEAFRRVPNADERAYWVARTYLARATCLNQMGRPRDAELAAERGLDSIERAIEAGVFSEGLRVLADLHSQMMMAKGLVYMIRNGDEARDAALEALERAPRSIKAQITVAGFLLNAPPMAGGDTEQARFVLESALAQQPASQNDRFLILGWLAQASHELDDLDAAEQYFAEAFAIYPESEWLAEIGDEISD